MPQRHFFHWIAFCMLSFIWGSSFILMKISKESLSGYQIAGVRIFSAALVCLPLAAWHFRRIPRQSWGWVLLSGFTGSLFPAVCFATAIAHQVDSALASILNAMTPLWVLFFRVLFFKKPVRPMQVTGVLVGFVGLCLLLLAWKGVSLERAGYASLVILATLSYGFNVNLVGIRLNAIPPLSLTILSVSLMTVPAGLLLWQQEFFALPFSLPAVRTAVGAACLLGVVGTALATVAFYYLVQKAGGLFASLTTYAIPVVAIFWGILAGEPVTALVVGCLLIILSGVYLVNR